MVVLALVLALGGCARYMDYRDRTWVVACGKLERMTAEEREALGYRRARQWDACESGEWRR